MLRRIGLTAIAVGGCLAAGAAQGQQPVQLPGAARAVAEREMSTDRPDITESPFTVSPGRVQLEGTLIGYTRAKDADGVVSDAIEVGTTTVRLGLTDTLEVGVAWQPYGTVRTRATAASPASSARGIGSVDVRAKLNLWGANGLAAPGASAGALMGTITLPTDRDNGIGAEHTEGTFLIPLAFRLSDSLSLGTNVGLTLLHGDGASRVETEVPLSASLGVAVTEQLGSYFEVAARFGTDDPRGDPVLLSMGLTYAVTSDLQLDLGSTFGLTSAADRVSPFVGLSRRF